MTMPKKTKKQNDRSNADASADASSSFEDAVQRLGDAVRQLEEGNLTLDESLDCYEDGIRFLSQCQKMLAQAERKIELLSGFDSDGNPIMEAFDDEHISLEQKADERSRRRTARRVTRTDPGSSSVSGRSRKTASGVLNEGPPEDENRDVDENSTLF